MPYNATSTQPTPAASAAARSAASCVADWRLRQARAPAPDRRRRSCSTRSAVPAPAVRGAARHADRCRSADGRCCARACCAFSAVSRRRRQLVRSTCVSSRLPHRRCAGAVFGQPGGHMLGVGRSLIFQVPPRDHRVVDDEGHAQSRPVRWPVSAACPASCRNAVASVRRRPWPRAAAARRIASAWPRPARRTPGVQWLQRMKATVTLTSRGVVTLPAKLRHALGLRGRRPVDRRDHPRGIAAAACGHASGRNLCA